MKLVKEDIINIDTYLRNNGIKFMDVRYELIDHLVSEYEAMDNYLDLRSFLHKRLGWCKNIAKKKAKSIHWAYQKSLWQRCLKILKSPFFYVLLFGYVWLVHLGIDYLGHDKTQNIVFYFFIGVIVFQLGYILFRFVKFGFGMKMLSANYLFNICSLPHMFLYWIALLETVLKENNYLFYTYIGLALLFNIAALLEIEHKGKQVLKEYKFLKTYLA